MQSQPAFLLSHALRWTRTLLQALATDARSGCPRRGGVIIKQMREQSGAHIKVLSPEELPACALSNDRVVQCGPAQTLQPLQFTTLPADSLSVIVLR